MINPDIAYIRAVTATEAGRAVIRRLFPPEQAELLIAHPERCTDRAAAGMYRTLRASELGSRTSPARAAASRRNGRLCPRLLSDAQIATIRASGKSSSELAHEMGCSASCIRKWRGRR